ncbi:DNA-binding transcriptional regulator, MerR family [Paenibacillus sp. UNC496MF]|uniref:MerR family transcriptional regulator n=1 Tax=Paenibacillus sp. UNC496MF TaxID=1502753 RepID=UPI0008E6F42B|nr:MerR family transcriptional regulator [Paenibacillus sp. UNC496MF]SFI77860.1 DNA-binding transcriptional regulator, MerR family [Paenibacillus sp. UNC496MF]
MKHTVKELSELSGATIKTLHHYHKIGLLLPGEISEAGYRYYGRRELERLQRILFYKELDFPLERIRTLMDGEQDPREALGAQKRLLQERRKRLDAVIGTLAKTLESMEKGEAMQVSEMFEGLKSEAEWREALDEQRTYLKDNYGVDILETAPDAAEMNEQAREAMLFMNGMADALRGGAMHADMRVRELVGGHLAFLNARGHAVTPEAFAAQTAFFLQDAFHLRMLEEQQTGLAYYLQAAAAAYAAGY